MSESEPLWGSLKGAYRQMMHSPKQRTWLRKSIGFLTCSALLAVVMFAPGYSQGPTPHNVALTWTPSVTTGVTAQKVYRATVAGGPYVSLGTAGAAATSFIDASGTGGTKYFYVVTALVNGNESISSNEVNATFLANPAPPTGLAAVAN